MVAYFKSCSVSGFDQAFDDDNPSFLIILFGKERAFVIWVRHAPTFLSSRVNSALMATKQEKTRMTTCNLGWRSQVPVLVAWGVANAFFLDATLTYVRFQNIQI